MRGHTSWLWPEQGDERGSVTHACHDSCLPQHAVALARCLTHNATGPRTISDMRDEAVDPFRQSPLRLETTVARRAATGPAPAVATAAGKAPSCCTSVNTSYTACSKITLSQILTVTDHRLERRHAQARAPSQQTLSCQPPPGRSKP